MDIRAHGYEGLQRATGGFLEAWESLEFFPIHFIDAGDNIIVWLRVVGRGRGSGVPVEARIASVYTIHKGLVTRWQGFDTLSAATAAVGI
jgi:hypothetical protein